MVLTKGQLVDARNRAVFFVGTSSKLDDCQALEHILDALDAYGRIVALRDRLRDSEAKAKYSGPDEVNLLSKDGIEALLQAWHWAIAKSAADEVTRALEGNEP